MESSSEDDVIMVTRSSARIKEKDRRQHRTPKKLEMFDKIEKDYQSGCRSKSIEQLKLKRRGPNNLVLGENTYNTDTFDPDASEDGSSLKDFIASDDSEETESSDEDEDEEESVHDEEEKTIQNKVITLDDDDSILNGDNRSSSSGIKFVNCKFIQRVQVVHRRRGPAIQSSDEEEDDAPIQPPKRKKSRSSAVIASQSPEPSDEDDEPLPIAVVRNRSRAHVALSSSDDERVESICSAPRKLRREKNAETPIRRSSRLAANAEERERSRRMLFDPYMQDRNAWKEKVSDLLSRMTVEESDSNPITYEKQERPSPVDASQSPRKRIKDQSWIKDLGDVPDGITVDVCGKVVFYGEMETRFVSTGIADIREIRLQDETGIVRVTLWRDYAENDVVKLNESISAIHLKKTTYQDTPQLSTFYSRFEKLPDPIILAPIQTSELSCTVNRILTTYVYHACPSCYSKVDMGNYYCAKCGVFREETAIGVVMRILVDEDSASEKVFTVFTKSVWKLCSKVPKEWNGRSKDEIEGDIVDMVEAALPRSIICAKSTKDEEIVNIRSVGNY